MKTTAIISEYNPFHMGHLYHMERTESIAGESAVICLMSGNFVQRGDFAAFDKYARASAALRETPAGPGADLVLELPLTCALSSAEGFALGAVRILNALGVVDYLSFGSELGEIEPLDAAAELLLSAEFPEALGRELKKGSSFASARERAARSLEKRASEALREPNNILAVEYLKALKTTVSVIKPITIKREGTGYHSLEAAGLASATAIRSLILSGGDWNEQVPDKAKSIFEKEIAEGRAPAQAKNAERAILARLRTMSDEEYSSLPYGSEGLSNRFMKYARSCADVRQAVDLTKTKRYAHARIRRMLICAYLGITEQDMEREISYVRAITFTDRGREVLRRINKSSQIPVITRGNQVKKLSPEAQEYFDLECKAADLYTLACPSIGESGLEWTRSVRADNG